jgi:signal transduction histidine kinase
VKIPSPHAPSRPWPLPCWQATLVAEVEQAGLPVTVTAHGPRPSLPPGLDLAAYRIVQEALTNSLKHAHATTAHVSIRYTPAAVDLEIRDNGTAPTGTPPNRAGHGLLGLRERAALFGGEVQAGPGEGGGYLLRARLPLDGAR